MALFAEARRIVGSVWRLTLFRNDGRFPARIRTSRRSRALNNQMACLAVVPYSTRESSTALTQLERCGGGDLNDTPVPVIAHLYVYLRDKELLNLRDLPRCNEKNIDRVWDCRSTLEDNKQSHNDVEERDSIVNKKCLVDGKELDRTFGVKYNNIPLPVNRMANESTPNVESKTLVSPDIFTPGYAPELKAEFNNSGSLNRMSLQDTHKHLYSCSNNTVPSCGVVFCDSKLKEQSSDKISEQDEGLPTRDDLINVKNILTAQIPNFFVKTHQFSFYAADLVFENNYEDKPFVTHGIGPYAMYLAKKKILANLRYVSVKMHLLKVTTHEEDGCIRVRWRVSGLNQLKMFMFWKFRISTIRKNVDEESEWIDGFSTFYVQRNTQLIYKHVVDKVIPDEGMIRTKKGDKLIDKLRRRLLGAAV